ncbi:MAG: hypothetical protein OEV94_11960 [Deltaproteobacteria bacterium]|nr:hypothetical protein [Deltaproteobacteria bacterium]
MNDAQNANLTPSTGKVRVNLRFTREEVAALAEFQAADIRADLANAVKALTMMGLDTWRNRTRPKNHVLAPPADQHTEARP